MSGRKRKGGRYTPPKLSRRAKVQRLIDSANAKRKASPTGTIPVVPK